MSIQIGSDRWYVMGYHGVCLLAVKVRIEDLDDASGYYWVDEPTGDPIPEDELLSKDEALQELRQRGIEHFADLKDTDDYELARSIKPDLAKCRAYKLELINQMWLERGSGQRPAIPTLTLKNEGVDWIGCAVSEEEIENFLKRVNG